MIYTREFWRILSVAASSRDIHPELLFDLGVLAGTVCTASALGHTTEPSPWHHLTSWFLAVERSEGHAAAGRVLAAFERNYSSYYLLSVRL